MIRVNNRDTVEWTEGMTVQDVLEAMEYTFTHMTVTVNEELVPEEDYGTYKVPDNAEVTVFHLAHGG
jgi:thiamine biosynthesis protein ThiS